MHTHYAHTLQGIVWFHRSITLIKISFSSSYVILIMIKSDMLLYFTRHDSLSDLSSAKVCGL